MKQGIIDKLSERMDSLSPQELRQIFMRMAADHGLMEDVFDALRDGLILFGDDGKARVANRAACKIYGKEKRDLLLVSFSDLVGGTCAWEDLQQSGIAISRDLHVNYPEERHYNFFMSPINEGSEYLLLIQDDTERRALGEATAEAEQMELLSFLASGVAHELGNPINSLGLNLQLLQRKLRALGDAERDALQPLIENSLAETKRLDALIRNFLQSMRPTNLERSPLQLDALLHEVLESLGGEIAPRGIAIHEDYAENLPVLQADRNQLFQVFYNLIRNAYQSIPGPEGGIFIQTLFNDNDVIIRIGDSGSGISHEVMGSMYEPFRSTKKGGHGLGLLIVRRIVKAHAGSMGIASKPGTGTTVTITLPRADRMTRLLT